MNDFEKIVNPGCFNPGYENDKVYPVFVAIKYKEGKLSITGVEGPTKSGNARGGCGQITDFELVTLSEGWTSALVDTLRDIWKRYHLNDLVAGCEHQRALGWHKRRLDPDIGIGWKFGKHANMSSWARPEEHPRGVLGKPCPVCGYKYGTAWKVEEIPQWAIDCLKGLPTSEKTPAWV